MWIGSPRNNTETPLALKWRKTVIPVGVHLKCHWDEIFVSETFFLPCKHKERKNAYSTNTKALN